MRVEDRLVELGIALQASFPPIGSFVNTVRYGEVLVLGGQVPWEPPDRLVVGKLGQDLDVEQGRQAARLAAMNALSSIREALGGFDQVRQIVHLRGVVNTTPDFMEHTRVIDAASDAFVDVFGDIGRHARLAVGVSSLPADMALEIEVLVHVA